MEQTLNGMEVDLEPYCVVNQNKMSTRNMTMRFEHDWRHNCDNDECTILHKRNRRRGFQVLYLNGAQISKTEGSASCRILLVSLKSTYATSV